MACRIHKRKDGYYTIYFHNPILKVQEELKRSKCLKGVLKFVRKTDCDFYELHPYLIPTGITYDKFGRRFRVYNRFHIYSSHKSLMEAVEQKQQIIEDLTSIKYVSSLSLITNK